ncbi:hypothetical protein MHYP_G00005910 [Metynnis hypsauchen]
MYILLVAVKITEWPCPKSQKKFSSSSVSTYGRTHRSLGASFEGKGLHLISPLISSSCRGGGARSGQITQDVHLDAKRQGLSSRPVPFSCCEHKWCVHEAGEAPHAINQLALASLWLCWPLAHPFCRLTHTRGERATV